jgi:hypothetical protein
VVPRLQPIAHVSCPGKVISAPSLSALPTKPVLCHNVQTDSKHVEPQRLWSACMQAVPCKAFCEALCAANPAQDSLLQGMLPWYSTPGTLELSISTSYTPSSESLTITIKQRNETAKEVDNALTKPALTPLKVCCSVCARHGCAPAPRWLPCLRLQHVCWFACQCQQPLCTCALCSVLCIWPDCPQLTGCHNRGGMVLTTNI